MNKEKVREREKGKKGKREKEKKRRRQKNKERKKYYQSYGGLKVLLFYGIFLLGSQSGKRHGII
jgi:hypothetical protein